MHRSSVNQEESCVKEITHYSVPPVSPAQPQLSYSSSVAQIIQSLSNLLSSVNRETLIIVLLFVSLFATGYLCFKQMEVVDHNTDVMIEMKAILKDLSDFEKMKK
jgi:hypothetical protein